MILHYGLLEPTQIPSLKIPDIKHMLKVMLIKRTNETWGRVMFLLHFQLICKFKLSDIGLIRIKRNKNFNVIILNEKYFFNILFQ